MAELKQCIGRHQKTGEQCKKPAIFKKDYCLFHDPDPSSIQARWVISKKGGYQPKRLIGKIPHFNGKTSGDFAEALRLILNQMIQSGTLRTLKDAQTFRSLLDSFVKLETSALVPARMAKIEKLLAKNQLVETAPKTVDVESA